MEKFPWWFCGSIFASTNFRAEWLIANFEKTSPRWSPSISQEDPDFEDFAFFATSVATMRFRSCWVRKRSKNRPPWEESNPRVLIKIHHEIWNCLRIHGCSWTRFMSWFEMAVHTLWSLVKYIMKYIMKYILPNFVYIFFLKSFWCVFFHTTNTSKAGLTEGARSLGPEACELDEAWSGPPWMLRLSFCFLVMKLSFGIKMDSHIFFQDRFR